MADSYAEQQTDLPDAERTPPDEPVVASDPVVVRRHAGVSALIGAAASAVAIAYLWRASQSMAALDWTLFLAMAAVACGYLASLVDARTPLLVADDLGVRIRIGREWRGLPWDAIGHVVVHPRRGGLRDGRFVVVPRSLARALDGLDGKGRRHVALNQKMYGAALAVPLGLTTRISKLGDQTVAGGVAALARGRAEVVELDSRTHEPAEPPAPTPAEEEDLPATDREVFPRRHTPADAPEVESPSDPHPADARSDVSWPDRPARRSILGGIGTLVSRAAKGDGHDLDRGCESDEQPPAAAAEASAASGLAPAAALRDARPGLRAEATLDPTQTVGGTALAPGHPQGTPPRSMPEGRELRRPGSVDLVLEQVAVDERVRPISALGDPVAPLVIDDYVTEPAYDPVIGPEITAARTRLGISVDELAERTRIRPHVIESIEVDDFAPCGGDFYARGHLRTLARILGKDPAPLLAGFEERYATAPVNARRVFEAELATGMTGSMRSTVGGPNWGLLVGVVLGLVLVWGALRLFTAAPEPAEMPTPVINGSVVVQHGYPTDLPGGSPRM